MHNSATHRLLAVALGALLAMSAWAFNATHFTTQSQLATGKWVKIAIPETGMYEITYDELAQMGFSSPENVRIYGRGGDMMDEILSGHPDDLSAVPMSVTNDKIVFYAQGAVNFTLSDPLNNPNYTRRMNAYDRQGYYFLTERTDEPALVETITPASVPYTLYPHTSSLDYFWHEQELASPALMGKQLLGETIGKDYIKIDYYLPNLSDPSITVLTSGAAKVTASSYLETFVHSGGNRQDMNYSLSSSKVVPPKNNFVYYSCASPCKSATLTSPAERGQLEIGFWSPNGNVVSAYLDYFIITYQHHNIINAEDGNQVRMGYAHPTDTDVVKLPQVAPTVMVWDVTDPATPKQMLLSDPDDEGSRTFAPGVNSRYAQFVAFDPALTLKKISGYKEIENQNLHGMETPDLLIVTNKVFLEQANRLARLHEQVDGIQVAVVEQEQVFNEFSSGCMDAMAVRLLCKMLYDRNSNKFKNLLMFGPGTFDNRGMLGGKVDNMLINYETDNSEEEDYSFTTDDFFGLLADNAGANVASGQLYIGVGRITCRDVDEAKSDVDKLVKYIGNPDYGTWRNNLMIISDQFDQELHMFQAERVAESLEVNLGTQMNVNKVYCSLFPRAADEPVVANQEDHRTAKEGRRYWEKMSKQGQYFASYIGHAGHAGFTKVAHMWTMEDVQKTSYEHMPIWTTACCDVARYDGPNRGVAEVMFHKPDGGGIAMLTSSRQAYATDNDVLNRAFINAMFSFKQNGSMPTLGEAYKACKLHFAGTNYNKMSFFLLGDPAIQVNYPKPFFKITSINGTELATDTVPVYPLQEVTVNAQVMTADGASINTEFTGDAYVTLYDYKAFYDTVRNQYSSTDTIPRAVFYDRTRLAEVKGRVQNGLFTGKFIVPRNTTANGRTGLIRVYAHQDGTPNMVNGQTEQVRICTFLPSQAINDEQPPVIESMFINDEATFADGHTIQPDGVLYIHATDDFAFNTQNNSVGNGVSLMLDGGNTTYLNINNYLECSEEGKTIDVAMPLAGLTEGMHTLSFNVYDVAGNKASKSISFVVTPTAQAQLTADDMMAIAGQTTSFDFTTELRSTPEVTVKVTDNNGRLVWSDTTTSFPLTWDLKDNAGNAVPAGAYRYFATFNDGSIYGGTAPQRLIVLAPAKTNK